MSHPVFVDRTELLPVRRPRRDAVLDVGLARQPKGRFIDQLNVEL
jgi:hypothetical protein